MAETDKNFTNSVGMEMICLSSGYWVSKYETTQEQFVSLMGINPSCNPMGGLFPVENMTKDEAEQFCNKLTEIDRLKGILPAGFIYSLPDFKQWKEYVADASLEQSITKAGKYNFSGPYNSKLIKICPVGSGEVNRLGIYDLRGNVCELAQEERASKYKYSSFGACYQTGREEYLNVNNICHAQRNRYDTGFRCVLVKGKIEPVNYTDLQKAIIENKNNIINEIKMQDKKIVNACNIYGEAPLHLAILEGNIDLAKLLVISGAELNMRTIKGLSPVQYACSTGNPDILKLLLENGASIQQDNVRGMSCMIMAIKNWNYDLVKVLSDHGFNDTDNRELGYNGFTGGTALLVALEHDRLDIAKEILRNDVDFTIVNTVGFNPLIEAAYIGWDEGVKIMLDKGADVNFATNNGRTALYYAKLKGHSNIVKLLLDNDLSTSRIEL